MTGDDRQQAAQIPPGGMQIGAWLALLPGIHPVLQEQLMVRQYGWPAQHMVPVLQCTRAGARILWYQWHRILHLHFQLSAQGTQAIMQAA